MTAQILMFVLLFAGNKTQVGVRMDEDALKILDDVPSSAVEMQVKTKVRINFQAVKILITLFNN